jgi:tRNA G18 (ribose-2'-O)-methylase SpoU
VRGYFGVGIESGKTPVNFGTLVRSAHCFGAQFVFTIGRRYQRQPTDTLASARHLPCWSFGSIHDLVQALPDGCQLIGVELLPSAEPLSTFKHPERAAYILGAEDDGLSEDALRRCAKVVRLPGAFPINVAACGTVVLYDRISKRGGNQSDVLPVTVGNT